MIVYQVLNALKYLHSKDVVHRDIKTANIMIINKKDRLIAKLIDFGSGKYSKLLIYLYTSFLKAEYSLIYVTYYPLKRVVLKMTSLSPHLLAPRVSWLLKS